MSISFDSLMARAAEPALQELVGKPAVGLLARLDARLAQPGSLREVALGLHSPQELLLDMDTRNELLMLLPAVEASALCRVLSVGDDDPYRSLSSLRIRRGSGRADDLLAFFDLVYVEPEPEALLPSLELAPASHGLFPHQRAAAGKVLDALREEPNRVLLHMPTGAGKTRTAMNVIARRMVEEEPHLVVWLAHSQELCEQAVAEFRDSWNALGSRPVNVYRWWGEHELDASGARDGLVVAGLAKAHSAAQNSFEVLGEIAGRAGLVVIDEAHQAIAPTYERILDLIAEAGPTTPLLGLTATPGRTWNDIDEDERLADFFDSRKVSLEIPGFDSPIEYLVDEGYLARTAFEPLYFTPGFELTTRDLQDLQSQLEIPDRVLRRLAEDEQRNLLIVNKVEQLARDHNRIIVFATTVEHARLVATVLCARGHSAEAVAGDTPRAERARIIETFRGVDDETRIIVNFGVLTAGFDAPKTNAAVIARPTQSLVLFSQMVGRATRGPKAGGNEAARVVTVVDTTLPGFQSLAEGFHNWEDVWKESN